DPAAPSATPSPAEPVDAPVETPVVPVLPEPVVLAPPAPAAPLPVALPAALPPMLEAPEVELEAAAPVAPVCPAWLEPLVPQAAHRSALDVIAAEARILARIPASRSRTVARGSTGRHRDLHALPIPLPPSSVNPIRGAGRHPWKLS